MKSPTFDCIIVGSGPAGVSAAFPLLEAGINVLMVDGGVAPTMPPINSGFSETRLRDLGQRSNFIGNNFYSLLQREAISPKFRVPFHEYVFDGFLKSNNIQANDFIAIGSMAVGGLSNAWGCGVAKYSQDELIDFPFNFSEIEPSYESVSRRIGISGNSPDDLSSYFGLDKYALPSIQIDEMHSYLLDKYEHDSYKSNQYFRLGRSRVAALSRDEFNRKSCNLCGNCLWGCGRKSLYSSSDELAVLSKYRNFKYQPGLIVDHIVRESDAVSIRGHNKFTKSAACITSKKILLAAGTLASTAIAFRSIGYLRSTKLLSNPTAAYMLWLPKFLGRKSSSGFALGQLSYSLRLPGDVFGFGSTFSTSTLPLCEFAHHIPLGRRYSMGFLSSFMNSCVVGNIFLPGRLMDAKVGLDENLQLIVTGDYRDEANQLLQIAKRSLAREYLKLGALMLPGSFKHGRPGGDIHYAATMPMKATPSFGETTSSGEIFGLSDVHVIDGASLSSLPEKSHTLTIMANADRIAKLLVINFNKDVCK